MTGKRGMTTPIGCRHRVLISTLSAKARNVCPQNSTKPPWATERALEFLEEAESDRQTVDAKHQSLRSASARLSRPRVTPTALIRSKCQARISVKAILPRKRCLRKSISKPKAESPEARDAKRLQALYYAMIALIDDQLARIIARLDATGQRENTIILFTSDHGESLGDHGLLLKGCRFYEGLVRVPLIFNCPGTINAGTRSPALVELLDMSATLIDFAGVEAPDYFQGTSLRPILCGEASPEHHRSSVRSEYFDALDKKFCPGNESFATMYRTSRYKLVVYHRDNLGELFDLETDPHEFTNLWDDPSVQEIKAKLILESFNDHVMKTTDVGSRRIAPM